jgi:hypothetical protein
MEALIVVSGNPVDGFTFHGPFHLREDAIAWAEDAVTTGYSWWIANLNEPEEN